MQENMNINIIEDDNIKAMRQRWVLLIGPIAPPQWGPAVRNRIMLDTFRLWGMNVVPLNTLSWKRRPFGFLFDTIKNVWKTPRVILAVSRNGRFLLLPILIFIGMFLNVRIALYPAGGLFAADIEALPQLIKWIYLRIVRRCDLVCVERPELAEQIQALGLQTPMVMPNFKVTPEKFPEKLPTDRLRLLYLSRIRAIKGIESLLDGLDILAEKGFEFKIDFYGIVQPDYKPEFQAMLKNRPFTAYQGVLEYSKVISSISGYDIMIFPTLVETEGFPGVLVDAALAGVTVVASDVPSNREIIDDGVNGLLFRPGDPADIAEKLEMLINDEGARLRMAKNNRTRGQAYDVKVVLKDFINKLTRLG